jgi:hypothetical protein
MGIQRIFFIPLFKWGIAIKHTLGPLPLLPLVIAICCRPKAFFLVSIAHEL